MVRLVVKENMQPFFSKIVVRSFITGLLLVVPLFFAQAQQGKNDRHAALLEKYQTALDEHQGVDQPKARLYADSLLMLVSSVRDTTKMANAMKVIGDLQAETGDFTSAVLWYHRAITHIVLRPVDQELAVRIHNNLGGVYLKTGNYDKALIQYNKAFSLGKSTLTPVQKATLLNNLGLIYRYTKQYPQSRAYLLEALDIYRQQNNAAGQGQVYNNLGILAQQTAKHEEALAYYTKAKKLSESIERPTGIAYASSNLASLYLDMGEPQKALEHLYTAYTIKKSLDDKLGLLNAHSSLGTAWLQLARTDSALYHYQAASLFADSVGNIDKKIEALTGLADVYEARKQNVALARIYPQMVSLKDSAFTQERAGQLAIAQAELEMVRKEQAIEALTAEAIEASHQLQAQQLVLLVSAIGLILLTIFAIFYVRRFRSERKAHRQLLLHHEEIRQQKDKIEEQHRTIQQQNKELQEANKLIEHYNVELESVNLQLEDKIRERTRALMDTYKKLSFHINNTPLAVLEWNKHLSLVRWPEQAEKIFGYKAQQVLGQTADSLPFMQNEKHQHFLDSIRQGSKQVQNRQTSFQQELQNANGDPVYVEWSHSVLTDSRGKLESVLSIANDVSLREKAFHDVSFINQELDTFIYKASHDLRGPIARMQGIINLGKIETKDEKALFYLDLLNKVSVDLHNLLMRLLMVHNIHQHQPHAETITLHGFVDELQEELPAKQQMPGLFLQNSIPKGLQIESEKNLLSIILLNLLDNGFTFADHHQPLVKVTARVLPDNKLCLQVQDNGPGIPENLQEKVFDMFFQGSTKSTGMGLGLYMVRKAVRRLGGEVKLDRCDSLTTFTVIIPESDMMVIHQPQGSLPQESLPQEKITVTSF